MNYDASLPIAVFLGPSLEESAARSILPANYYPPVRMGDVYRLITSGVRLIVIIDGVFHKTTPVWQREIVSAIDNGIIVVGASSMGALRAVELEPLGMIGVGTIVEWYRAGRIEGDDEVALQHADAEYGYRALSEPLVNIRWNLDRAAAAGVISGAQCQALTAAMHALDHTRRSYASLVACAACHAMPAADRTNLESFLRECGENLKAIDARAALAWCAARLPELIGVAPAGRASFEPPALERGGDVLMRGVPAPDGSLVTIHDLLVRAAADRERTADIIHHAARRFYLLDWAARAGVTMPDGVADAFEARWLQQHRVADRATWLAANGMTEPELGRALRARAFAGWLLDRRPEGVGLDRPFLEAWADQLGIDAPDGIAGSHAFRAWLVERTPAHFGFDRWSADIEFTRELQLAGEIARLAGGLSGSRHDEKADARAV